MKILFIVMGILSLLSSCSGKKEKLLIKNIVIMKIPINLSVYLMVLFFTLTACGERTDGLYGTRYSRSELEEMGVNTEHLFIFDGDKITYNGKEFWPGMSIEEVTEIFGEPYTRTYKGKAFFHEYITYFWDDWGVMVSTQLRDSIQTVMMVDIRWNLTIGKALELANDDDLQDLVKSMKEDNPKTYFKGNILVGGVPLGRMTNVKKDFMKENELLFFERFEGEGIVEYMVTDSYDYTKLKNFNIEDRYMFYYLVLMSMDYTKTESFMCILNKYYL